ncbi:MAG: hypothetical protein RDU30_04020 [Desulfovibrionaceae bacterium]|nr:hypothetical protein [Desulfovibrionaceae bacterium]
MPVLIVLADTNMQNKYHPRAYRERFRKCFFSVYCEIMPGEGRVRLGMEAGKTILLNKKVKRRAGSGRSGEKPRPPVSAGRVAAGSAVRHGKFPYRFGRMP